MNVAAERRDIAIRAGFALQMAGDDVPVLGGESPPVGTDPAVRAVRERGIGSRRDGGPVGLADGGIGGEGKDKEGES